MEVLRLENLSKFYTTDSGIAVGLTGISLSFSTGEFVALTGESGSGKSTMAHVLGGILPYESGELYIYGQPTSHYDAADWSRYRRDMISFISQSYGILPGNTVAENVESALRFSGLSKEEAREKTASILEEVELTAYKGRKAGKLSSGQKQRLSIARALAKPSKILIADEPTGNLDRENSEKIIALLKRAAKDRLVLLITHEFEEAKDVATRRIILSDGEVVTDAKLSQRAEIKEEQTAKEEKITAKKRPKEKKKPITPYVCGLSVKSHPIFSGILCLLLAVTTFITFVFLGNFIIALDDTSTRIYDSSVFFNGTPNRLVVMREGGADFTEEDFATILSQKYVESIDKFGPAGDLIYHYKEGIDHTVREEIIAGPAYDPITNPNDYTVSPVVELYDKGYQFVGSLPLSQQLHLTAGRKAESAYEIISADPACKVGDTVKVYIQHPNAWNIGAFLTLELQVVGETDFGEGLYFSDQLAEALIDTIVPSVGYPPYSEWRLDYVFLPFAAGMFPLIEGTDPAFTPTDGEYIFPSGKDLTVGTPIRVQGGDGAYQIIHCAALHTAPLGRMILTSPETFESLLHGNTNQISVYTKDYSYTERVIDALKKEGYVTVSPYQLGATRVDANLKNERLITLGVCAATFLVAMVLQCILLFTMFASLHEYYKLMASTGLTTGVAHLTVSCILLFAALLGEAVGAGAIALLSSLGVRRVVDIFKYLDPAMSSILFVLHFALVLLSLLGILWRMQKTVFGRSKAKYDVDFTEMEEGAV